MRWRSLQQSVKSEFIVNNIRGPQKKHAVDNEEWIMETTGRASTSRKWGWPCR